ncbi:MAG: HEAT repeat domain-containing protein [Planctomycetes bacterium]|nr:HEAT repeat domain-containing protein [Planctomycetota bacterium]
MRALLPALFATLLPPLQGDDTVADFRKFWPTLKDTASRAEAVRDLEGIQSAEVLEATLPILVEKGTEAEVRDAIVKVYGKLEGKECIDRLAFIAVEKNKSKEPFAKSPLAREATVRALGMGKRTGGIAAVVAAASDPQEEVRIASAEALGKIGTSEGVPALTKLAADKEPGVRRAVADALGAIADPDGNPAAVRLLEDREWPVRASAIAAVARLRTREAIPILIEKLKGEEGRLVDDAARSLKSLTATDFGADYDLWKKWWDRLGAVFVPPTLEEMAKLEEKRIESSAQYGARKDVVKYHNIQTPSKRILFIVDISGSMEDFVVERERFKERGFTKFRKIDIVREELARTIRNLEPHVQFNILAFATKVKPWRKWLVPANSLHKMSAADWADSLEPIGGSSSEGLATAGLLASASLEEGRTNTYAALLAGLGVTGPSDPAIDEPSPFDTVFFLSDGRPSVGEFVDTDDILAVLTDINRRRKIVLHVLAIGEFQRGWMERLARENGGQFVDLGR